mmetsp:Transcript_34504/g.83454  ORF Transcript_34504/g.83454 Transcript_34504/m.83454 type:complete len:80 (-) Transcript_34504:1819-2058(-)
MPSKASNASIPKAYAVGESNDAAKICPCEYSVSFPKKMYLGRTITKSRIGPTIPAGFALEKKLLTNNAKAKHEMLKIQM